MEGLGSPALALIEEFLGRATPKPDPPSTTSSSSSSSSSSRAYVTMLTSDGFMPGVRALHSSLRMSGNAFPLLVMATAEVSPNNRAALAKFASVILVDCIHMAGGASHNTDASWRGTELTKLNLWNLTQFERVVYLDADCLVFASLDHLFNKQCSFCAAPDVFPPDRFNAGVMVVQPSAEVFRALLASIATLPSYDDGDTGFLNAFFHDWFVSSEDNKLRFQYNAQRTLFWLMKKNRRYWEAVRPIKVLHYSSSPKPWASAASAAGELEWIWWQVYQGISMCDHQLIALPESCAVEIRSEDETR